MRRGILYVMVRDLMVQAMDLSHCSKLVLKAVAEDAVIPREFTYGHIYLNGEKVGRVSFNGVIIQQVFTAMGRLSDHKVLHNPIEQFLKDTDMH